MVERQTVHPGETDGDLPSGVEKTLTLSTRLVEPAKKWSEAILCEIESGTNGAELVSEIPEIIRKVRNGLQEIAGSVVVQKSEEASPDFIESVGILCGELGAVLSSDICAPPNSLVNAAAELATIPPFIDSVMKSLENPTQKDLPPPGGIHSHHIDETGVGYNGSHVHLFEIDDHLIMTRRTDPGGANGVHSHELKNGKFQHDGKHKHILEMPDGESFEIGPGGPHHHELPGDQDSTPRGGAHTHKVSIDGHSFWSVPAGVQKAKRKPPKSGAHTAGVFRWYGNASKKVFDLAELIPSSPQITRWVEPCCGSCAIYLGLMNRCPEKMSSIKEVVLNDKDAQLITALKFLRALSGSELAAFKKRNWVRSEEQVKKLRHWRPDSKTDEIYRFVYLLYTEPTRGHLADGGRTKEREDKEAARRTREEAKKIWRTEVGRPINIDRVIAQAKRLRKVKLTSEDASECIKRYRNDPGTMLAVDPPYSRANKPKEDWSYGREAGVDYDELASSLRSARARVFLLIDKNAAHRKRFDWLKVLKTWRKYNSIGAMFKRPRAAFYDQMLASWGPSSVGKSDDSLFTSYPKSKDPRPGVLQLHAIGRGAHIDFRVRSNGKAIGWTLLVGKGGSIPEIDNVKAARDLLNGWTIDDGNRWLKPMEGRRIAAVPKPDEMSLEWLQIDDEIIESGQPGAGASDPGVIVQLATPRIEWGLQHDGFHEYFLSGPGGVSGSLRFQRVPGSSRGDARWLAEFSRSPIPAVLSSSAVSDGRMPPLGRSAMPKELEKVTPEKFRFWKSGTKESARVVRDQLVKAKVFTPETVAIVDGKIRRVTKQTFLVANGESFSHKELASEYADRLRRAAATKDDLSITDLAEGGGLYEGGPLSPLPQKRVEKAKERAKRSTPEHSYLDDGRRVSSTGHILVRVGNSHPLSDSRGWAYEHDLVWVSAGRKIDRNGRYGGKDQILDHKDRIKANNRLVNLRSMSRPEHMRRTTADNVANGVFQKDIDLVRIEKLLDDTLKFKKPIFDSGEQRFTLGLVLEPTDGQNGAPWKPDAQKDVISALDCLWASRLYMIKYRNLGLQHKEILGNNEVFLVDNFIVPIDETVVFKLKGYDGKVETLTPGTWLMGWLWNDDELWNKVKNGEITGYSIGGDGTREPANRPKS